MPTYSEAEARAAIAASDSWSGALKLLGRCPTGGAPAVLKKWVAIWEISTAHFDPNAARRRAGLAKARPLVEHLTEQSTIERGRLKASLYRSGLKQPICELCGQEEMWQGKRMSLILDHINGTRDDNRLENLRIVCPNCNATLDTHCGKSTRKTFDPRVCPGCGRPYVPRRDRQRFCSSGCASRARAQEGKTPRKAVRPPLEVLLVMIAEGGYESVGRRFGVSGVSIRKWVRDYGIEPPSRRQRDDDGAIAPNRTLSERTARRALELLAQGTAIRTVARMLGVSRNTIRDLARGTTYKHLARPAELRDAA